ncbi:unnamed protein product [Blepharisma stoltei]|uniref:Uncharacterized protein n=1 Tax=Blepharisma stoltei TaxID=1481888 RepID=A0AAU9JXJ9_9CILI|nr:unnamed protein product [Blepharisma stoltei]
MIQKQILSKFLMRKSFYNCQWKFTFRNFSKKLTKRRKKEVFVKFCTVLNENFPPNTDNSSRFEQRNSNFMALDPMNLMKRNENYSVKLRKDQRKDFFSKEKA